MLYEQTGSTRHLPFGECPAGNNVQVQVEYGLAGTLTVVDDQAKAQAFYTEKLGLAMHHKGKLKPESHSGIRPDHSLYALILSGLIPECWLAILPKFILMIGRH